MLTISKPLFSGVVWCRCRSCACFFFFFSPINSAAQPFSRVRCTLTGTSTAKNDATGQKGSQTQNWRTVKHHSALTYSKLPSHTRKGARHFIIYLWFLKSHRFSIGQLLKDFYWERHNYFLLANRITVSVMLFFFFSWVVPINILNTLTAHAFNANDHRDKALHCENHRGGAITQSQ